MKNFLMKIANLTEDSEFFINSMWLILVATSIATWNDADFLKMVAIVGVMIVFVYMAISLISYFTTKNNKKACIETIVVFFVTLIIWLRY